MSRVCQLSGSIYVKPIYKILRNSVKDRQIPFHFYNSRDQNTQSPFYKGTDVIIVMEQFIIKALNNVIVKNKY